MTKVYFCLILLLSFTLAACGDEDTTTNTVETESNTEAITDTGTGADTVTSNEQTNKENISWENQIALLVSDDGSPSDKYKKLESYLVNYESAPSEVEQFKNDTIADYEAKRYLADLENEEYMLSMLLKTHIVEQNNQGAPLGDFASAMHQNLKNAYFGEANINSESVIANEEQMNKALSEM